MKILLNPVVLRMGLLLFTAILGFGIGIFAMRRLRRKLAEEPESIHHNPMPSDGLPVHAYHAVIQQLKQQKHELAAQQLSERRKAKASDTLSSTVLANLSIGVVFLNTAGLVRQANAAARKILGFASPIGLQTADLFRSAHVRRDGRTPGDSSIEQLLAPALSGKGSLREVSLNFVTREGETRVLEVTATSVLAEDASVMGATLLIADKTDLERIRHDQRTRQEVSAGLASELRDTLATISGYAQQLAKSRDPELARQLADSIAREAAQLDRTIGSFLGGGAKAAVSGL